MIKIEFGTPSVIYEIIHKSAVIIGASRRGGSRCFDITRDRNPALRNSDGSVIARSA